MKNKILLFTLALTAITRVAHSEGVLGQNYWGASYEIAEASGIDAWGVTAHYNKNLFTDSNYSYDLNIQLSHAELDDFDVEATGIEGSIIIFSDTQKNVTPFLGLSIGYGEGSALGFDDDSFRYQISVGGEIKASDRFAVTPYARYFDYTSVPEGDDFEVGIEANLWITKKASVGLDYSNVSAAGTSLNVYSLFFRSKF